MQKERKGSKMKKLLAMATSLALLATKKRKLSPVYETMFPLPIAPLPQRKRK